MISNELTNNIPLFRNNIEELYEKYYYNQDDFIKENYGNLKSISSSIRSSFKNLSPITKEFNITYVKPKRTKIDINLSENEYLTSLRSQKINLIERISLEIGGCRIDQIEGEFIPILQTMFKFNKDEIPLLIFKEFIKGAIYHQIRFLIDYKESGISDVLEFQSYEGEFGEEITYPILQCQFLGKEQSGNTFRLDHCHNVAYLFIENNFNSDPIIEFDGDKYQLEHQAIINNYRVYDLTKDGGDYPICINWSKTNKIMLYFKETISKGMFFTLNLNIMRNMNGLMGLKYGG